VKGLLIEWKRSNDYCESWVGNLSADALLLVATLPPFIHEDEERAIVDLILNLRKVASAMVSPDLVRR
jgi:hypothetical protein